MNANTGMRKIIKFIAAYGCTLVIGLISGFGITNIDIVLPLVCFALYLLIDTADRTFVLKGRCDDAGFPALIKGMTVKSIVSELKYSLPPGAIFALSVTVGRHYDIWGGKISPLSAADILLWILLSVVFTFCIILLFAYRDAHGKKECLTEGAAATDVSADPKKDKKRYLIYVLIMLLCWLPYYLTMFPGNLGKDTFESIDMVLGNIPWTNHHPIFFTALIALVYKLTECAGSMTVTMAVFTFLHMVVFACTLAYIVMRIYAHETMRGNCRNISKGDTRVRKIGWSSVALAFFALHPFMAMYSIYITKDVLFSCALCMLVFAVYDMAVMAYKKKAAGDNTIASEVKPDAQPGDEGDKDEPTHDSKTDKHHGPAGPSARHVYIRLALSSLAVMLLRNNGLMIVAVLAIILGITYRREIKRLLPAMLIPIVVFVLAKNAAYRGLDVSPESFAEAASIPLQQVGYVVIMHGDAQIDEALGTEYADMLKSVMPYRSLRTVYTLGYVDPYKFDPDFDDEYFNAHKAEFIGAWAMLLMRYPGDYVKAYLAQTAGYWHYGETNTVATQGVWEDNEIGVSRIDVIEKVTGISLYGIIEKLMLGMRKAPLLCILSSMAMELYALLLAVSVALRERKRTGKSGHTAVVVASAPLLLLWLSLMAATPAFCLFRYMFPYFMLWPCILYIIAGVREVAPVRSED